MVAKSLEIVVYIILTKISQADASSIIKNSSNVAAMIFVCAIPIIKPDDIEF